MNADEFREFIRERDEALLSLDEAKIRAYLRKYNGDAGPADPEVFWCGIHKAITACLNLPREHRLASKAWLAECKYSSMDDGDLS